MSTVFVAEKTLPMDVVRIDGGTQSRCRISQEMVDQYAESMADGAAFPPGVAFFDGSDYWLADGFHRYHALRKNKRASMVCRIVNGTLRDAILYSFGANGMHGMQMSNEDKRRIVLEMLNDFEWSEWSDREIARACHVSHPFVSKLRASLSGEQPETTKYKDTKTGKVHEQQRKKTSAAGPVKLVEPSVAQVTDNDSEMDDAMAMLVEEVESLKAKLAVAQSPDPEAAQAYIDEITAELKQAKIELAAVTKSRDQYQAENAQMKKQIKYLQSQIKKAA